MPTQSHSVILAGAGIGVQEPETRNREMAIANGDIDWNDGAASGETVTHYSALGVGAVWQAMTLVSTGVAKLPLNRYVETSRGREVERRHPVQMTINRRLHEGDELLEYPVAPLSAYHGWQQLTADAFLWGNGYAWLHKASWQLLPLMPNLTCYDSNTGFYATIVDGEMQWLLPSEVFHLKGVAITPNTRGPRYPAFVAEGLDMIQAARQVIGNALAAQGFQSKLFKYGMKSGGILQLPAGMSKPARDKVEEGFKARQTDPNAWFRTVVLREGAAYHQTTMDAAVESAGDISDGQVRDIARYGNMSPSDVGLEDANGYGSRQEDTRRFHDRTLQPWLESITAEAWLKLTTGTERRMGRVDFEHDASAMLRLNELEQNQADNEAIQGGWLSRQEARDRRSLPKVDGLDQYLYPLNMGIVGQEPEPEPVPPAPDEERTHRLRQVTYEMGRMARHKATDAAKFVAWIDDGLEYCRHDYQTKLGEDPGEFVDPILAEFRSIAERVTPAGLAAAVDEFVTELEKRT